MYGRALPPNETPIPLHLVAGQRIVTPGMDPVLGWIGSENARAAQPLVFPQWLLEPRPSETIAYACNLPAPPAHACTGRSLPGGGAPSPEAQSAFLASSLAGGRVSIVTAGGKPGALAFRWAYVTVNAVRGAVWRCFVKLYAPQAPAEWTPLGHDYIFEAARGFAVSAPASLRVTVGNASFKIAHPEGKLTCFPSQSGLVKVTRIAADGWAGRELQGLWLFPGRSIVARFSDGAEMRIGTAAPARAAFLAA